MTRKDYERLAAAIKSTMEELGAPNTRVVRKVAIGISIALAKAYPNFDREHFLDAAGAGRP